MITSTRIGRHGNLCNSMFQFAAVLGMAKKTGLDIAVPHNKTYYDHHYERNNTSIFDGFDISTTILESNNHKFKEVEFPFYYTDHKVDDFTDMIGYFQSEKYFENAEQEIRNQFKFKDFIKELINSKIKDGYYPDPNNCTSLHIRLGDYVKLREFHPAQPTYYWKEATQATSSDKLIIFSDDIETAKKMFGESDKIVYSTDTNPFAVLYHMSLCSNNIICNSSFSWWGAWLGETKNQKQKTIIAPKVWFGPGHRSLDPKDIIPTRWITI